MARILIVDDDSPHRRSLCASLAGMGFEVEEAESGLRIGESVGSRRIDLVIAALFMPECDGFEVTMAMRRTCPKIPVIVLGDQSYGETHLQAARLLGAAATHFKGVSIPNLVQTIRGLLTNG